MSNVNYKTTYTVRHEFIIPQPAYADDMRKAIHWAEQELEKRNPGLSSYGDAWKVTHDDENIIVYFEEDAKKWPPEGVKP